MQRSNNRAHDKIRPVNFHLDLAGNAHGSVLVSFGNTQVICAAMLSDGVPRWMMQQNVPGGWLTAEYNMLPYSTLERKPRDITRGQIDGRSSEIQRLIGRSLRAAVDLKGFGQRTLWIDCDVLRADGGTRTASITGACVAAAMAFQRFVEAGMIKKSPIIQLVAGISAGIWQNTCILDLEFIEDHEATVDFNYAMTEKLELIEVQGSGEESVFTEEQLFAMLALGKKGVAEICALQREVLNAFDPGSHPELLDRIRKGKK